MTPLPYLARDDCVEPHEGDEDGSENECKQYDVVVGRVVLKLKTVNMMTFIYILMTNHVRYTEAGFVVVLRMGVGHHDDIANIVSGQHRCADAVADDPNEHQPGVAKRLALEKSHFGFVEHGEVAVEGDGYEREAADDDGSCLNEWNCGAAE